MPYLCVLAAIVASTDLLATMPHGMAVTMTNVTDVCILDLPFDLPKFNLTMQWHDRLHRDPGHAWLRDALAKVYLSEPKG